MRGVTAGLGHLGAARTDDAGWQRALPHDETSGRALGDTLDTGNSDA